MYRNYEIDGFHLIINDRFISQNVGKDFLEIGSQQELVGRVERDNISLEITYKGFGKLIHKRTKNSYNDLQLSRDQWEKVKVHFNTYPTYYDFHPIGLLVCVYEAGAKVKKLELPFKQIEREMEQLLIKLFVQHVACKPAVELYKIREKKGIC